MKTGAKAKRNQKGENNHFNDTQFQLNNIELKLNIFFFVLLSMSNVCTLKLLKYLRQEEMKRMATS